MLAGELRAYETLANEQARVRRLTAQYFARTRHLSLLPAAAMTALLVAMTWLVNFAIFETTDGHGNLAGWVLSCANAGLWLAERIGAI